MLQRYMNNATWTGLQGLAEVRTQVNGTYMWLRVLSCKLNLARENDQLINKTYIATLDILRLYLPFLVINVGKVVVWDHTLQRTPVFTHTILTAHKTSLCTLRENEVVGWFWSMILWWGIKTSFGSVLYTFADSELCICMVGSMQWELWHNSLRKQEDV